MLPNHRFLKTSCPLLLGVLLLGCDEDRRLVEQAEQSQQRQTEQNREMARLNQQVAEGSKRLVEADAQSRQDFMRTQHDLDRQRTAIVDEQKELAQQRQRDPMVAAAISALAILLACLAPLALAVYALHATSCSDPQEGLAELLMMELATGQPTFLDNPRLPSPGPAAPTQPALPPVDKTD